ncbi:MAG: 1,4-dihydroxy-6-naphthoate synthase [Chloroflexi bacterium]|nr:1,4-dihydroxy-6-naphthoate synthase [Chloroflexota bacterium]MBT7080403.1 1,4-dihydroxy-6-naphthoate synthase [Chloroflexota bacterium]MBT7289234.1 1,4-dihydroxy-6-naphthoate synthase [Chloroflexota bacterium]
MKQIDLAFSPCPNDTFVFHAMLNNCIDTGPFKFTPHVHDVEVLNLVAAQGKYQITKLSFYAYMLLKDKYLMLNAGAALGYGCGPLLVAKNKDISVETARIAVPGEHTTANLLLKLWRPDLKNIEVTGFDQILPGIESGRFDAGVIIHESRFTYQDYGCVKIVDFGEWWEFETGLPIPLGCIAVRKDPEMLEIKDEIERIIRDSIRYAFDNRDASRQFIKQHSQELDDDVIDSHIALYVNDFSLELGDTGSKAIERLEEMARCQKIL